MAITILCLLANPISGMYQCGGYNTAQRTLGDAVPLKSYEALDQKEQK